MIPRISIIIVNYRTPALLRLCLASLIRGSQSLDDIEVIIVDSASTVETANVVREEFAQRIPNLLLVPFAENVGYTRGCNEGIRRARGKFLTILNPDIVVLPHALDRLAEYLAEHPSVGLVGPWLMNFDGSRQESAFLFPTPQTLVFRRIPIPVLSRAPLRAFTMQESDFTKPLPVDWIMGSALMTRRDAIDRVGLLDEQLFLYMSEVDWAWRFWENGYQVIAIPEAKMYHYHQRQSKGAWGILDIVRYRQTRWHIRDAWRYFRKHGMRAWHPSQQQAYEHIS